MKKETLHKAQQLELEMWHIETAIKELETPNVDKFSLIVRHVPNDILSEWIAELFSNTREILMERLAKLKDEFEKL